MIKKLLLGVLGVAVVFLGFGFYASSTPEGPAKARERRVIEECWKRQGGKQHSAGAAQFIAGACANLETEFERKWRTTP